MNEEELNREMQKKTQKLKDILNYASITLLDDLTTKSPEEQLDYIRGLKDSSLKTLMEKMAIPNEYYEVCAIVKQVSEERGLK